MSQDATILLLLINTYVLIITELFGGGIIRVEFEMGEIGQKSINAQSHKVELDILFSSS